MSDTTDTATMARIWIETNIALFVVIVVSAVLLIVALLTLIIYCCCCRKKRDHWNRARTRRNSRLTSSQFQAHSDAVDGGSMVTAPIRAPATVEVHLEGDLKKQKKMQQQQPEEPEADYHVYNVEQQLSSKQLSDSNPVIVVSQEESVGVEDVRIQGSAELHQTGQVDAEFPNLPPLPQGVEVTAQGELKLHSSPPPEIESEAAVSMEVMTSQERLMRLPRTEVVLRTESPSWQIQQQQHQQPLHASPPAFQTAPPKAAVVVKAETSTPIFRRSQPTHEHKHGSSIYQSDDNEITIVDSDFSDYEDSPEDEARKRSARLSAGVGVSVDLQAAGENFGWETLPNQTVAVALSSPEVDAESELDEELPIRPVNRNGEEFVPTPSPSLEEQRMRREENLVELDRTLDVFELQAEEPDVSVSVEIGGGPVEEDAEYVDEEAVLPIDRSQVPH